MTGICILISALIISETLYKINGWEDVGKWWFQNKWEKKKQYKHEVCKNCGHTYEVVKNLNYCPKCGNDKQEKKE